MYRYDGDALTNAQHQETAMPRSQTPQSDAHGNPRRRSEGLAQIGAGTGRSEVGHMEFEREVHQTEEVALADPTIVFASASSEWTTPQPLFNSLDKLFHFETDVCATAANTKCARYYTKEDDGLAQEWRGACWCNPPYGRGLGLWVEKACASRATVVMLLLAYTSNAWWHDYVIPHGEVIPIRGRLQYGGCRFRLRIRP